jgi:TonB family protein
MLTGRRPFEGDDISEVVYRVVHAEPAPPSAWVPGLPPAHDDVFRRALAKDPGERFASATGLVAALDRRRAVRVSPETADGDIETHDLVVEFDDGAGAPPAGAPPPIEVPAAGRGTRAWAIAAALAAVVGLGAVGLRSGRVPLFRKPVAAISVMTEPPNAVVRVDGLRVGRAPVTQEGLAPGPHTVQVGLDGFTTAELSLQLQGDEMPVPLHFALQPMGAELQVLSEPAGATVRLDGKIVGLTPLESVPTLPGTHELTVEQTGFRPWAQTVQVTAGDRIPLNARMEAARPASAASAQLRRMGWVRPGDVAALGPGITPPEKVSGEAAVYPPAAKRLKLEGAVAVALTVTETGVPADVRVVHSGGELLDAAMIAAVRTWRYAPATQNGVKVRVRIQADQKFTYKK